MAIISSVRWIRLPFAFNQAYRIGGILRVTIAQEPEANSGRTALETQRATNENRPLAASIFDRFRCLFKLDAAGREEVECRKSLPLDLHVRRLCQLAGQVDHRGKCR